MPLELFTNLGLALAIGFLVGIERGWRARDQADGSRTAGIRTYALTGLLGGIAGLLGEAIGGWAFAAIAIPFAIAFIQFKGREQAEDGDYSVTAIVAALLVFALGAYATIGNGQVAGAAGVVVTTLLAFKGVLHTWLKRLSWEELRGALILLAMTFVALPLLPDRGYGPFDCVNPHELWLLTIVMAGVSFAAYVAIRIFGPTRGAVLASVMGALVSSTAVTLYLARLEKTASNPGANAGAALLAGAVMAARLSAIALVLSPPLFARPALPLGLFGAVSIVLGFAVAWRAKPADGSVLSPLKSPFEFGLVFKFALVLGAIMAATRILSALYGASGLLPVAALGGLVDADAVTLSTALLTTTGLDLTLGAYAVLLAVGVDGGTKAVIAFVVGGIQFGACFTGGSVIAILAAAGGMAALG